MPRDAAAAVSARIKPLSNNSTSNRCVFPSASSSSSCSDSRWLTHVSPPPENTQRYFPFDHVLHESTSQNDVYTATMHHTVDQALRGLQSAIVAFGQTGSGKTYTMGTYPTNPPSSSSSDSGSMQSRAYRPRTNQRPKLTSYQAEQEQQHCGLLQMAITDLFQNISTGEKISISALEVYSEQLRDLLSEHASLNLRSGGVADVYSPSKAQQACFEIDGLSQIDAESEQDAHLVVQRACRNRCVSSTTMNKSSSRSHLLIIIRLPSSASNGTLVCVDLAGSEKQRSSNTSGKELHEACSINKSLSALAGVVSALSEGRTGCVPYRESKLTKVLQSALRGGLSDGTSYVQMIVCVNASITMSAETLSTLRFAAKAKRASSRSTIVEPSAASNNTSTASNSPTNSPSGSASSTASVPHCNGDDCEEQQTNVQEPTDSETPTFPGNAGCDLEHPLRRRNPPCTGCCSLSRASLMAIELVSAIFSAAVAYLLSLCLPVVKK